MKGMYTPSAVKAYLTTWLVAGKDASVCVRSQSGYRAGTGNATRFIDVRRKHSHYVVSEKRISDIVVVKCC